jgi:3,4-dihydroxy-2-butanone 4-phosphate synthase
MSWSTMEEAIATFKKGQFVMVMDSDDREDECDLVLAAESVTEQQMAFAIRHSTGIVCIACEKERLEHFGLHPATTRNTDANGTNFYVSTDYLPGTKTGVSAADRAATARALCDLSNTAEVFSKPGHMFPLCAQPGGVLTRAGHTESTFDMCRLSGMTTVGILSELMHDDGTMMRRDDALEFGRRWGIPVITVQQIIEFRQRRLSAVPVGAPMKDGASAAPSPLGPTSVFSSSAEATRKSNVSSKL